MRRAWAGLLAGALLTAPASAEAAKPPSPVVTGTHGELRAKLGGFCWRGTCTDPPADWPRLRAGLRFGGEPLELDLRTAGKSVAVRFRSGGGRIVASRVGDSGRRWELDADALTRTSRDVLLEVRYPSGSDAQFAFRLLRESARR